MRKFTFLCCCLLFCQLKLSATVFDFSLAGEESSNDILKEYVKNGFEQFRGDVVSYYYDIDNDGMYEILGIVKSNLFYNLEGYKLIVLKNKDNSWFNINTNIHFDISKQFEINKNKAIYYKSSISKNKKCECNITNKLSQGFNDSSLKRNIKNTHQVSEGKSGKEYEVSSFSGSPQRSVRLDYADLDEKLKHYLEMK